MRPKFLAALVFTIALCTAQLWSLPARAQATEAGELGNPSVGIGLSGLDYYASQLPFLDIMKTASTWIGHLPGQWGGWDHQRLADEGYLDTQGWLKAIPPALESVSTVLLADLPVGAVSTRGVYRLTYEGEGQIEVRAGGAPRRPSRPGLLWFEVTPDNTIVNVVISRTDPRRIGEYIRNITIVHERDIAAYEAGEIFNPQWLALIENMRMLRFMDWMQTNNSTQSDWAGRPQISDYTYTRRGAPLEIMLALANRIGADPWFNMPHLASNDYMAQFAAMVRDGLRDDLKVHVELSNEVWNFIFEQAKWADEQGRLRWGRPNSWVQFYAVRAMEMARIWEAAFAGQTDRLVKVIATHSGWEGLETEILEAPLWVAEDPANHRPPAAYFDAYAITGYFSAQLGGEKADLVLAWIALSRSEAEAAGKALGLTGQALADHVQAHKFDAAIAMAARELRDGSVTGNSQDSIAGLADHAFPRQAGIARDHGLDLVMYEGGTHVVGVEAALDNAELTAFYIALNYSPQMGALYTALLDAWKAAGGKAFALFVDVAAPSKWGSWGALRHLDDSTPRWDAITRFNAANPAWWETRPDGAFLARQ